MSPRILVAALGALCLMVGALLASFTLVGEAQTEPARLSFQIATGPSGGTYFPVGQTLAALISNPPGVDRCQIPNVCGPQGLIVSVRTSDGAVANVLAVNNGTVDSGLAQADVVSQAMSGTGLFRRFGKQVHIRVLSGLFPEDVHLVAAPGARIAGLRDLKGKRVSLGPDDSGTIVTARAILAAYGINERDLKLQHGSTDIAALMLEQGKLDAFFFVGGAPVPLLQDLVEHNEARLVPLDGPGRDRLLKSAHWLTATTIPAGTYSTAPATPTVKVQALWIVRDSASPEMVYAILKSLYNDSNRSHLDAAAPATRAIRIDEGATVLPGPLHPGAQKFFREMGKLPHAPKG